MAPLKVDELVRVRADKGIGWVEGVVRIASGNGKSIGVSLEDKLGVKTDGPLIIHPEWGLMVLFIKSGARWIDTGSGAACDIERRKIN
jgi:hypothetical protein